ncbi:MFS transporter [Lysobacter arenosi]|uniref:MFS transporter n=1 Tax=Lysobacter arenosi TaxID=2795387 RepID=A0ABX7R876_9GAMM|nr:MFS transporter [Lysobacter arenosi]QSX73723.1 MFS transporter [Lysobacter arenosi]
MSASVSPVGASVAASSAPWSAVLAVAFGAFALVTSEFLPVGLLPQIARDLRITEGQAGLMVTLPGFLAALAAPLTIGFTGRFDRSRVLVFLLGLLVISNALVAVANHIAVLLAGRVLLGVAVGGFWTIGGSLGPRLRPGAEGIRATSIIFSGVSLGTVAGVPTGALVGELIGWRWSFAASSAMALIVLAAVAMWLPSIRAESTNGLKQIPAVLRQRNAQVGLLAAVLIFIAQFATYTYITPFLNQITHIDARSLSVILLGYGLAGFGGNLLGGWAAGRNVRLTLVSTALLIGLPVLLLALTGANAFAAVTWVLLWGLGFGMLPIAMQTWLFSAAPDRLESMAALFVSIAQAAIGAGALLGGLTVDHLGVVATMWVGGALAMATALLIQRSQHGRPTTNSA